jgi:heme oxygenase
MNAAMQSSVSAMGMLRAASWPCHQDLERRLDVSARFGDRKSYAAHIAGMWGFCAPFEAALGRSGLAAVLTDYASRRKLPLLTRDLQALGLSPAALPICEQLPECQDTAAAFGCLYVFEGASLGGQALLPLVANRLGLQPAHGAAFLASYGDQVTGMWRRFGAALEEWCESPERRATAVAAAVSTFECLGAWLCRTVPR